MTNPEIDNPPLVTPRGWDDRFEPFPSGPLPGSEQPCGCYIRLGDYESILCGGHLAELNFRPYVIEDSAARTVADSGPLPDSAGMPGYGAVGDPWGGANRD